MKSTLLSLFLAGAGCFTSQAAVILSLNPVSQTVNLGSQAVVQVRASGLEANQVIGAFDVLLQWNASLLSLNSNTFGVALGANTIEDSVLGANNINMASVSLDDPAILAPLQANQPFVLFTLRFNTLAVGTASLIFPAGAPFIIADGDGNILTDASATGGSITIINGGGGQIPEPSTVVLLSAGLAALIATGRRRKR